MTRPPRSLATGSAAIAIRAIASRALTSRALTTLATAAVVMAVGSPAGLAPARAYAQAPEPATADTFELPGIVVTATKLPLDRDALPTPVTVLTRDELRQRGIRSVADALREVPGAVVVRAGPAGSQTSLFMRGGESDYVKVLVDGVPVNEPGGAIDFADLSVDQVERIEVVRGPVSVLYGSDAVSGVVQIFTRRGGGEPAVTAELTGGRGQRRLDDGTHAAYDAAAGLTGAAGAIGYAIGGGRSYSDGTYPFNNERTLHTANGRLAWSGDRGHAALTTRFSDSRVGLPTDGAGNLVDRNAYIDRRLLTTSLEASRRLSDRFEASVQLGRVDRAQSSVDRPDAADDTLGLYASRLDMDVLRRSADLRLNTALPRSLLTAGLSLEDARATTDYSAEAEWGPASASSDERRTNRGYYVQLVSAPLPRLDVTAGGRIDRNDAFGDFETWRLGASYRFRTGTRIRGALGRAFREPTFGESYGSGFGDRGNPELVPERSASREVGIEQRIGGGALVSATWFDQRFRDLIQFTFVTDEPEDPNYYNVGAARARGLELAAEAGHASLRVGASYTWLRTEVLDPGLATDAGFVRGEPLLRRPRHSASLTARYSLDQGALGLTVNHVGAREDLDFGQGFPAPRVTLPAHATVDLALEHALPTPGPGLDVLMRVHNLTDSGHEGVAGFPAPGRTAYLGVRVRAGGSSTNR